MMTETTPTDDAQIRDLISDEAVAAVAHRHKVDADELWSAVEQSVEEWAWVAPDMVAKYVEDDEMPGTIHEDDHWLMFAVRDGEWGATMDELARDYSDGVARSTPSVFSEQAEQYGASSTLTGSMNVLAVRKSDL